MDKKIYCETCQDTGENDGVSCQDCCSHEWDSCEGGMCINCGREDYYNFVDEDYGQER